MTAHPTILLIEDSPGECELFRLALSRAEPTVSLQTASDGPAALRFLRTLDEQDRFPSLVLLDLRLAGQHGIDFLRQLREEGRFTHLPVVVFTTSDNANDIARCYANGANSYVVKPATFSELIVMADLLCRYWLNCNLVVRRC